MFYDHDLSINWEECDPLTPALFSLLHRIISHLPTITHTAFSQNYHPAPLNTLYTDTDTHFNHTNSFTSAASVLAIGFSVTNLRSGHLSG